MEWWTSNLELIPQFLIYFILVHRIPESKLKLRINFMKRKLAFLAIVIDLDSILFDFQEQSRQKRNATTKVRMTLEKKFEKLVRKFKFDEALDVILPPPSTEGAFFFVLFCLLVMDRIFKKLMSMRNVQRSRWTLILIS